MAPVTECVHLALRSAVNIDDPSSSEGILFQDGLSVMLSQPGLLRLSYGRTHEDPNSMKMLIDWDSLDRHVQFMNSEPYMSLLERLSSILEGSPELYHISFSPFPPTRPVQHAPTTEVLTMYFPADISDDDKPQVSKDVETFISKLPEGDEHGYFGASSGWAVENLPYEKADGGKATAYGIVFGWQSKGAHMKFRDTETFKEAIPLLRNAPRLLGMSVCHISFTTTESRTVGGYEG